MKTSDHQPKFTVPKIYQAFIDNWHDKSQREQYIASYQTHHVSFIPNLLPVQALQLSVTETLSILRNRLSSALDIAIDEKYCQPDNLPAQIPAVIRSPVHHHTNGQWLKQTNMVGINVRTIDTLWNVINYALTLPAAQNSIHLLPIFEPGVVGSLYGMSSWYINPEFFSPVLATALPYLDTVDKQLRAVVNILHAMGRTVGLDVIPHTDRFSEIALAYPEYFEWLQRENLTIVDHTANLHTTVQQRIWQYIQTHGAAVEAEPLPTHYQDFFSPQFTEARRLRILFGLPNDLSGRTARRIALVSYLHQYGYEPVPATMGPPYRGLMVDVRPESKKVDEHGLIWRDFTIRDPQPMSRVFGPLARYKLYGRLNNNVDWQLDFDQPRPEVWAYVCRKYDEIQQRYGFDFMRGDMSHVQMRPTGVPTTADEYYDILQAVKHHIQQRVLYFGYFAETFLAPRDTIAYGDEVDHLEASDADTTLGDLQSTVVGSAEFLHKFRYYYDLLETRTVTPNFTIMTADKDDPRFDKFYQKGNELRFFIALLLGDMPSYMGLGFEVRDSHYTPAPNEHYTKLFVFQEREGPKATHGPYQWGKNGNLFSHLTRLKLYADTMWQTIHSQKSRWLIPPNLSPNSNIIAWTQQPTPRYLFIANTNIEHSAYNFTVPSLEEQQNLTLEFSTISHNTAESKVLYSNGKCYKLKALAPGEGRAYRVDE